MLEAVKTVTLFVFWHTVSLTMPLSKSRVTWSLSEVVVAPV